MKIFISFFYVLGLILFLGVFGLTSVYAAPESEGSGLFQRMNSKTDEEARNALRKRILEKKDELNGSSWKIDIKSQSGKGDFLGPDTLTFQNEKFRSAAGEKIGYNSTNYTLTVQENEGPTIWETMQTSKDGEVTFWRGEWKEDTMSGVISRQLKEQTEDYYFSSVGKEIVPKTVEEKVEETDFNTDAAEVKTEVKSESEVLGGAPVVTEKAAPAAASKPAGSAQSEQKKSSWFF